MVNGMTSTEVRTHEAAFLSLYDREATLVLRYLRGWTSPGDDLEDLVAETFTQAWRAWPRFSGGEQQARRWLLRIARNAAVSRWRHGGRVRLVALDPNQPSPGEDRLMERLQIAAALSHLGQADRELIAMRAAGLSLAEIGALTGRSEDAAKMAWHRAAAKVRPHLDREA